MTLNELLHYLDEKLAYSFIEKEGDTLQAAISGTHSDPLIGEIIKTISEKCDCTTPDCTLQRVDVVKSLGSLRLKFMADDAPVEGFRLVERTIVGIDDAFNAEAIRNKG